MAEVSTTNAIVVTINGMDKQYEPELLGVTMESTEAQILGVVQPLLQEEGLSLQDEEGNWSYTVRKALNSGNIYVFPKPVAGY